MDKKTESCIGNIIKFSYCLTINKKYIENNMMKVCEREKLSVD